MQPLNCHSGLLRGILLLEGLNVFSAARIGKRGRKSIKSMQKKKRYWADSSVRGKRWRANQGKGVLTYLHPDMVQALHEEAKRKSRAVWVLLRRCVSYGLPQAQRRGW